MMSVAHASKIKPSAVQQAIKKLQQVDYTTIDGRFDLYTHYETAIKLLNQRYDNKLLEVVIKSYLKEFKYSQHHDNAEVLLDYYKKHKPLITHLIKKLASKKEAIDFFSRIEIAQREATDGNG